MAIKYAALPRLGVAMKRVVVFSLLMTVLLLLAWPILALLQNPRPVGRIVVATGGAGGLYQELADRYRIELARYGIDLVTRSDIDGFYTLKALVVDKDVDAGFVKGGFVGGQQGRLATAQDNEWYKKDVEGVRSIGRMLIEPLWVFTRKSETPASLRELLGKRIFIGTRPTGTRRLVGQLLAANGVTPENSRFREEELDEDGSALLKGEIDAAFLLLPPEAAKIQKLLRNPDIRLMSFESEVDAYIERFPYLSKVVLHRAAVDFAPTMPETDVTMLTTQAALVVRTDLHPTLVELLTYAAWRNPKSGFDKTGEPILFYRTGQFPSAVDPEFETSTAAQKVQSTKDLPVVLRSLGPMMARWKFPFALTAYVSEHGGQLLLLLIPLLSIALPAMRIAPMLYNWTVRRRLLVWYRRLKTVEQSIVKAETAEALADARMALDAVDRGVTQIRVPLAFSSQLYDLRLHVNLVRARADSHALTRTLKAAA